MSPQKNGSAFRTIYQLLKLEPKFSISSPDTWNDNDRAKIMKYLFAVRSKLRSKNIDGKSSFSTPQINKEQERTAAMKTEPKQNTQKDRMVTLTKCQPPSPPPLSQYPNSSIVGVVLQHHYHCTGRRGGGAQQRQRIKTTDSIATGETEMLLSNKGD